VSTGQAAAGRRLGWGAGRKRAGRGRRTRGGVRRVGLRGIAAASARLVAAMPPWLRRWLLIALAVSLVLAAGYRFWLRDSPLVSVDDVSVTGLTMKDAARVRASLVSAAHTMTTLHVDRDELAEAVEPYPVVRTLEVETDFPHGLRIHVIEHQPAALVRGLPVAGDGTILRGIPVEGSLPKLESRGGLGGSRLTDSAALHGARVASAAPAALRPRLESIEMRSQDGIVVQLRDGPELIFGDATRIRAKWIAATRVLADPEAEGASYIDVRLPGRPAAGGLPAATLAPVAPAGEAQLAPPATGAPPASGTVDPTTEQLAPPATDPAGTAPQSAPVPAPQSAPTTPAPTDPTGAGGASPPAG
jgi:cell division protein FtsQ